ncbi:MAG: glucuronate isomerase, partial [Terriglobales bacterium]
RWTDRLAARVNREVRRMPEFLDALQARHEAFHQMGCRLSDHGLDHCFGEPCSPSAAASAFAALRGGQSLAPEQADGFASFMMMFFGRLDAERGWTKQLHLGAMRNGNYRMLANLGPDTGFDAIGDWPQAVLLGRYLDRLDREQALPRMILYNANPADDYVFATLAGNFHDERGGKIQFGSAWWFLDQKEAMEWQLNALANCGLLSRFVGMVTDSRSFMSYPRHEYFRRVLCNLLGAAMERGELPNDERLLGNLVQNICYRNAVEFLRLPGLECEQKKGAEAAS